MKNFIFIFIVFIFSLSVVSKAFSASIFITSPERVGVGKNFEVVVSVNSGGILINSADVTVDYDESLVSFAGYKSEDTIMKLWLLSPKDEKGIIRMRGVIPGGVSGLYDPRKTGISPIPLTRLLFVANTEGSAKFSFVQTEILQNDGKGTALVHEQQNAEVAITNTPTSSLNDTFDKNPPEPFEIYLIESSLFSRTPRMLAFEAVDKESGIKGYQIKIGFEEWKDAKNPEPISKNIFSREITIRALDFYGNFRDANIVVPGSISLKLLVILLIALGFSGILVVKLLKYKI